MKFIQHKWPVLFKKVKSQVIKGRGTVPDFKSLKRLENSVYGMHDPGLEPKSEKKQTIKNYCWDNWLNRNMVCILGNSVKLPGFDNHCS